MSKTLYEKVFDAHAVRRLPSGQYQLLMGLHLIHEVTSPQAFSMLRDRGLEVLYPERTFATVDHIIPTHSQARPLADPMAEEMLQHLERNCAEFGIRFLGPGSGEQGIVHVIGPERGLTQPGMTICCGDSHTSTHGAFGAIAFGIGTSQVRDVLATQCLAMDKLKVRRIEVSGALRPGVYAKDVILAIIGRLGVQGGVGYAYEYGGEVFDRFSMEERMTVCNMSIEGGARCGYVNPDQTTYDYLRGRDFAPAGVDWERAVAWWDSMRSDPDAQYDDVVRLRGEDIEPIVTWGITPGQSTAVGAPLPDPRVVPCRGAPADRRGVPLHEARGREADARQAHRRRLHRLVHQRPLVRLRRSRAAPGERPLPGRPAREGAGRARVAARTRRDRPPRLGPGVPRRRLRVPRGGMLDVPRHEPRQARGRPALRLVVEPQLQGPPGLAHRPHAADVAGHGGGRGDRG